MLLLKVAFELAIAYAILWVIGTVVGTIVMAFLGLKYPSQESGEQRLRKLGY
jgi:hypothetical protein